MACSLLRLVIGLCLLLVTLTALSSAFEERPPKQILMLLAHNPGMNCADSIITETKLQLAIHIPSAVVSVEYMDTERVYPNEARLAELKEMYHNKYKDKHFDLIISSDNDAFKFLLNNRDELFPGTPVVFCGVFDFEDKMLNGTRGFTGVVAEYGIADTLSLMLNLHPNTRLIAIVNSGK
jgi:hypothetical protein